MRKLITQITASILGFVGLTVGVSNLVSNQNTLPQISFVTQSSSSNNFCGNSQNEKFDLFTTENLNNVLTQYLGTQASNANGIKGVKKITMDQGYGLVSFTIDSQTPRIRNTLEGNLAFVSNLDTESSHPLNNNLWDTYVIASTVSQNESCPSINSVSSFDEVYAKPINNQLSQQRGGEYTTSSMLALNTLSENPKLCLYFKISAQPYGVPYGSPIDSDMFRTLTSFEYSYCPSTPKADVTVSSAGYCEEGSTKIELNINNVGGAAVEGYQEVKVEGAVENATVNYAHGTTQNIFSANGVVCPTVGGTEGLTLTQDQNGTFKLSGKGFNISPAKSCKYLLSLNHNADTIKWAGKVQITDEVNTSNNSFNGSLDLTTANNSSCNADIVSTTLTCEELFSSINVIASNGSLLIQPILVDGGNKITSNTELPKGYSMTCNYSINGINKGTVKDFVIAGATPGAYKINCSLEFLGKKVDDCKEVSYTVTVPNAVCGDGIIQSNEQCDNGTANNDRAWCSTSCEFRCDIGTNTENLPEVTISLIPYPLPGSLTAKCNVNGNSIDLIGGSSIGNFGWGGVFNVICEVNGSLGGAGINTSCKAGFNTLKGGGTNSLSTAKPSTTKATNVSTSKKR